uniref:2-keto-4-pentenoate hydratase n=1 Tax=Stappia sp. TaxID=1870903 RepID=UPI003BACFA15
MTVRCSSLPRAILAVTALVLASGTAYAECPDDATIDAFLAARAEARPVPAPVTAGGTMEDALCAQGKILTKLEKAEGPVVGYKAGLTSPKAQEAFGVTEPVFGTLLEGMILPPGATVKAGDANRALFEADLVVEIADPAVNDATTPEEVLATIAGIRPFIELPALVVASKEKLDGPAITSINVGAWKGVMGEVIPVPQGDVGAEMLSEFTAKLTDDATGETLSAAPGKAVLGNPLNAVIWIAQTLKAQGKSLQPGDLVSVGSIGPLHPMKPGMSVTLTYEGLPDNPSISAAFE